MGHFLEVILLQKFAPFFQAYAFIGANVFIELSHLYRLDSGIRHASAWYRKGLRNCKKKKDTLVRPEPVLGIGSRAALLKPRAPSPVTAAFVQIIFFVQIVFLRFCIALWSKDVSINLRCLP